MTGSDFPKRNQYLLQNIVGMINAMKSTIENFKSTINHLLRKDHAPKSQTVVQEENTPDSLKPEEIDLSQISSMLFFIF